MPTPILPADPGSLRLLLPFVRPYRWRVVAAAVALLGAAGLSLGIGQGLRILIDVGFASGAPGALDHAAIAMFAVVAGLAVATCTRYYMVS